MNKLIIGLIAAAIVGTGSYLIFRSETGIDISFVNQDENDFDRWSSDLALSDQDETTLAELDTTATDVVDDSAMANAGASASVNLSLDESAINQEAVEVDFSQTLDATASDEAKLKEIDQIYNEVSQ